jgi:ribonuclease Y
MKDRTARAAEQAERLVRDAEKQAETLKKESLLEAKDETLRLRQEAEADNKERRKEIQALESRMSEREASIDERAILDKRDIGLSSQSGQLAKRRRILKR